MLHGVNPALDELIGVLGECEHLLPHFHGPVCDMPARSGSDVTSQLFSGSAAVPGQPPAGVNHQG